MTVVLKGIVDNERIIPETFTECLHATARDLTDMLAGRTPLGETWRRADKKTTTGTDVTNDRFVTFLMEHEHDGTSRLTFVELFEHAPNILKRRVTGAAGSRNSIRVTSRNGVTYVSDESEWKHNSSTSLEFVESMCTFPLNDLAIGPEPLKIDTLPVIFHTLEETDVYEGLPVTRVTPDDVYKTFRDAIHVDGTEVTVSKHGNTSSKILLEIPLPVDDETAVVDTFLQNLSEQGWTVDGEEPRVMYETENVKIVEFNFRHKKTGMVVPQHVTLQGNRDDITRLRNDMQTNGYSTLDGLTTDKRVSLTKRICIDVYDENETLVGFVEGGPRIIMQGGPESNTVDKFARSIQDLYNNLEDIIDGNRTGDTATTMLCSGSFQMFVIRRITYYLALYQNTDIVRIARVLHVRFRKAYEKMMEHQVRENAGKLLQELGFTSDNTESVRERVLGEVGDVVKLEQILQELENVKDHRDEEVEKLIQIRMQVEDGTRNVKELETRLHETMSEMERMEIQHKTEMDTANEFYNSIIRQKDEELGKTNTELVDAKQRHEKEILQLTRSHEQDVQKLRDRIEDMQGVLSTKKEELSQKVKEHKEQLKKVEDEKGQRTTKLYNLQTTNDGLMRQIPAMEMALTEKNDIIEKMKTEVEEVSKGKDAFASQLQNVSTKLSQLENERRNQSLPPPPPPPAEVVVVNRNNNNNNRRDSLYDRNVRIDTRLPY